MRVKVRFGWAGVLLLLAASPAAAQSQSSQDCSLPGGCGSSSKPGGTELRPSTRGGASEFDAAGGGKVRRESPALGSTTPSMKDVFKGASKPRNGAEATK